MKGLALVAPAEYDLWGEADKIAFWINAYNALTLELIIDHYPIRAGFFASLAYPANSIRQIPGAWDKVKFAVMGKETTLGRIEHEVLRKQFREPRIHVALVCAAMSCPPLRREPYEGARLDDQLEDQAAGFFSGKGMKLDGSVRTLWLSSIFKWFGEDFVGVYGADAGFPGRSQVERAVLSFARQHVEKEQHAILEDKALKIKYLDYDWTLNEQKPVSRP